MNEIRQEKNLLRKQIKEKRKSVLPEDKEIWDRMIFKNLIEMTQYQNAENILCYVSLENEADTFEIIKKAISDKKNVFVPKVIDKEKMQFYKINSIDELKTGYRNIPEPTGNEKFEADEAFCIIPGLCFDKRGKRLGYGGGYYDRYFESKSHTKTALTYLCFLEEKIITDNYDVDMDFIVTQNGVIDCQNQHTEVRYERKIQQSE